MNVVCRLNLAEKLSPAIAEEFQPDAAIATLGARFHIIQDSSGTKVENAVTPCDVLAGWNDPIGPVIMGGDGGARKR